MAEIAQKKDFIELEYTGKLVDGLVFDTTSQAVAKEHGLENIRMKYGPVKICIGEGQVLPGLDEQLEGKELGKEYEVKLTPEKAFGKRDIKNMKIVPMSTFKEHKTQPYPGLQIDVDGERGIVTRVASGRVIVNFNHPLAGREVIYDFKIIRKITDVKEQISSYLDPILRMPQEKMEISVSGEGTEKKAVVKLPFDLPPQFTEALGKKLAELIKLKAVDFAKKEAKAEKKESKSDNKEAKA